MKEDALLRAIKILGSQKALAKALDVSPQQINNWLNRNDNISYDNAIMIEYLTGGHVYVEHLAPTKTKVNQIMIQWRKERELVYLCSSLLENLKKNIPAHLYQSNGKFDNYYSSLEGNIQ